MDFALITPARNERHNLPRLADAILAQTRAPEAWVIVDDGSDDGTTEWARELVAQHPWVILVEREADRGGDVLAGRREGRDLLAFRRGIEALPREFGVIAKVDADLSFAEDYWARLIGAFEAEPELGIAGGACHERENGVWVRRKVVDETVWGASRAYRSECLFSILDLEPRMGWDGLDEIRVQLRGYKTRTLLDLAFLHHRPEHAREPGRLKAHAAQGRASWYMGYRPSYLGLRTLYRAKQDPAVVGMLWGYMHSAATREKRFHDPSVLTALRERQRLSRTFRRGAPP